MRRSTHEFSENQGSLDKQISEFLRARPGTYIVAGPTLSDSSRKIYTADFIEGDNNIPGYVKDLTAKYRR